MDEIENAINESRNTEKLGEEVCLPSAPHPSPEQASLVGARVLQSPVDVITPPSNPKKSSVPEKKVQIFRFMVTKTDLHTLPANFNSNASDSVAITDKPKQVMKETKAVTSSESLCSPTTTTKTTSLPITTAGILAATRRPDDQGKIGEVAGTQTEDLSQHTNEKTLTTLSLLHGTVKELKTMTAAAPAKKDGTSGNFLQENKYTAFCFMVLLAMCLFFAFMWLLSTLFTNIALPDANTSLHANHSLARSGQHQRHKEMNVSAEETVMESTGTDKSSDPEKAYHSLQSGNVTEADNGEEQSRGGNEGETGNTGITDSEQLEEKDEDPNQISENNMKHKESEVYDSRKLQDHQQTKAAEIKPKILKVILLNAQQCLVENEVLLDKYVDFYRHFLHFFHIFGSFAIVQGKMLENRLLSLEGHIHGRDSQHYTTLAKMIQFEDTTGKIGAVSPFSGTTIFTCLHRHLQFMSRFLTNVLTLEPDASLFPAFRAAYQDVLAIHHTWFVKKLYLAGISIITTKQAALRVLSLTQSGEGDIASLKEMLEGISFVVMCLEDLTEATETILEVSDALQKIPKQVIT